MKKYALKLCEGGHMRSEILKAFYRRQKDFMKGNKPFTWVGLEA